MNRLLVLILLFVSLQVSAKSLPPILDHLPVCTPTVIDGIYVENTLKNSSNDKLIETSFRLIQKKAKQKRVDAVIITNLIEANKIIITADLIDFCDEDDRLSSVKTAYNQLSRKPISFKKPAPATKVSTAATTNRITAKPKTTTAPQVTLAQSQISPAITILSEKELSSLAREASFPSTNVTLSSAYGVSIDDSIQRLIELLGPASALFTLKDQSQAWLYGRELWFIIDNNKIQQISYKDRSLLNYNGKNLISYNERFDNNWLIDDKAGYRDEVLQVRNKLDYLKQTSTEEYIVSNHKNLLTLEFDEFSSITSDEPELLLTGFTFKSRKYSRDNDEILFSELNSQKLTEVLLPTENNQPSTLDALVNRFVPNVIQFSNNGVWSLLSKNVQVKHYNNVIQKVKLSESINYPIESDEQFMAYLKSINIPATREAMLAHFSDQASAWYEIINVESDDFVLKAEFTSEDDDAMLISLEVEYL
ncbi:hypothetical protein [Shewanella sp. 10N.286.48.B5]|uniref:hypothetical protein n=1 Tax=Shewanella sp. 10N.286.48.B5 TaxID=1880834 RepID=UPI000C866973|nr:hypothetical protein [Shewanella sp. 10N.286.48.B5]PMH86770.1 hypothetical protein BCU57_09605 [Shewanella sp. 10N.286.48.B5]